MILTQWSYKDALVQTYTLPFVNIIRNLLPFSVKIIIVTSENEQIALTPGETRELNKEWEAKNMCLMALQYKKFGIKKMLRSGTQVMKLYSTIKLNKIKTIHAFCTPAGSLGYILSKMTGAKLIIDSYEPHAESMVENGTWKKSGAEYRILSRLEKALTRHAVHLIGTTESMREYAKSRYGINIRSFFVKPACVDLQKFSRNTHAGILARELQLDGKIVCVFAGKLGGIYLKDEVFDFIRSCYDFWGDRFRFIMLSNTRDVEISRQVVRIGIPANVIISRFVPHDKVPGYLELADFALNPVKPVPTKKYCTSIKDGEYWAMGLPVIIPPGISDDSDIIKKEKAGVILNGFDAEGYKKAVIEIDQLLKSDGMTLATRIRKLAEKYRSISIAENIYRKIYVTSE